MPPPAYVPRSAAPAYWHHEQRRTAPWHSKTVRATVLTCLLALSGLIILAMVRERTGTDGFLVGLGLAILPVPLLSAAFWRLGRAIPEPRRNLVFAFAWGSCAATLVALLANGLATDWLATNLSKTTSADAETWGVTAVAPVVEESVKALSVLLLFLFRRRDFDGVTDGIVIAGITATGFAFTENVLYLGDAFGQDQALGQTGLRSLTAGTFFVRIVLSPFAHPLFTSLTGVAFGIAAAHYPRRRALRLALPLLGLAAATLTHAIWNGSAALGHLGFLTVYGLFMIPVLGALTWLAVWARRQELRSLRIYLPPYTAAGWLAPTDPPALSSLKTRAIARAMARRCQGPAAARSVTAYISLATSLAALRRRAHRTGPTPTFAAEERALLHELWLHKPAAHPALARALRTTRRGIGPSLSR